MKNVLTESNLSKVLLITISLLFIAFFYGKILISPNDYVFSDKGDGIKNYYTYAYHIKHDTSYVNFEGMNYPYGENFLYTDCHPLLANSFKLLSNITPFFENYSVGILNSIMILSIFLTFIIIYLLLIELNVNKFISILFSISITLLAPQLFRLEGHLALSYSIAIPFSWLILLKYLRVPKRKYIIILFFSNLFWMFIHAYLGIIVISFIFSIFLINILYSKQKSKDLYKNIGLLLSIILPILIFFFYAKYTDIHEGRTNNPSGFFLYNAELDDILIPHEKPLRPLLDKLTNNKINLKWEASGYIGIINTLFFISIFFISILSIFIKKTRTILKNIFENKLINISLIGATIVLLFAFAFPFRQFPNLLEIFPILKQFRATGRFVWPFYFAFTIFAAYYFNKLFFKLYSKNIIVGIIFISTLFSFSLIEGIPYHIKVSKDITKNLNLFNKNLPINLKEIIKKINQEDYQAIISLPFYYQGSETYSRPRIDDAVKNTLFISYHTSLPNICANLTRTSIYESKKIVQIVTPNYYPKEIINDIKSKKPFLIVKTGNNLTKYEKIILKKSTLIYKNKDLSLLQISPKKLFSDDKNIIIKKYKKQYTNLKRKKNFSTSDSSSFLYYNGFENIKSDTVFRGKGSFTSVKKGKNTLSEFPPNTFLSGKEYDISIWMYNNEPDALNLWFRFIIEEYDEANNKWFSTIIFPEKSEVINGNWSLIEGVFKVQNSKNKIYIVTKGKENSKANFHADDLLIKQKGVDIYKFENDSSLFYNNHRIKK